MTTLPPPRPAGTSNPPSTAAAPEPRPWAPPRPASAEVTARSLLFDDAADAGAAVAQATAGVTSSRTAKISKIAQSVAHREIREAIVDLLGIGLSGVVLRAWRGHDDLIAAARRTSGGGREVVVLADHTTTSKHSPHVSLVVNGVDLGRITIAVLISLRIVGATAVVERGALIAVQSGAMDATVKLTIEDVPVASRSKQLDAVAVVQLDKPVPLTGPPPRLPGPAGG